KLLRQAHDRELIDLAKEDDGAYTVKLRDATPSPALPPAELAAVTDADEALDPPMPESSAPPSMRPANVPVAGVPSRSARSRRGGRGRGGRGRGAASEGRAERGERRDRVEPREASESRTHTAESAPPPAPKPPPREPDEDTGGAGGGESFWSKVKRGLTGGT